MAQIRYTKYSFTDKETDEHFSVDFSQALDVKERHLHLVVGDLREFTISRDSIGKPFSSILEVAIEESTLKISKNFETDSLTLDPPSETDPYTWLNNKLVSKSVDSEIFNKYLVHYSEDVQSLTEKVKKIYAAGVVAKPAKTGIKDEIIELAGEDGQKYLETIEKISSSQLELNSQSAADDLKAKLEQKQTEISEVDERLKSVNGVIESQKKIDTSLQKFGQLQGKDINKDSVQFKQEVMNYRQTELQKISEVKNSTIEEGRKVISRGVSGNKVPRYTPLVSLFVMMFGVGAALFTGIAELALAGAVFGMISAIIWFRAKTLPLEIKVRGSKLSPQSGVTPQVSRQPSANDSRLKSLEKFFVDKAWMVSLRQEKRRLDDKVESDLGGQSLTEFTAKREKLLSEYAEMQKEIEELSAVSLSPEDYLKKRRELDMLKVDKARAESKLRKQENYSRVLELIEKLKDGGGDEITGGTTIDIIPEYDAIKIEGESIQMHKADSGWSSPQLTVSQLFSLLLYSRFNEWEADPIVPFVLVNVLHHLDEGAKDFVNARINELGDKGQVVLVNLAL
jgi:hypothetical protein